MREDLAALHGDLEKGYEEIGVDIVSGEGTAADGGDGAFYISFHNMLLSGYVLLESSGSLTRSVLQ